MVGLAAAPALSAVVASTSHVTAVCSHVTGQNKCSSPAADSLQVTVPSGSTSCPNSGAGAACGQSDAIKPDAGSASTPDGASACAANQDPSAPAACSDTILQPASLPTASKGGVAPPIVQPSMPNLTSPDGSVRNVELAVDRSSVASGQTVVLTATADASVTGSGAALEIFDLTTGKLLGSCLEGGQCSVAFAAHAGTHTFGAFVSGPTSTVPAGTSVTVSNHVDVSWIGVTLASKNNIAGPGQPITLAATSTARVEKTGLLLQIFDAESHARLTYCSAGNTCSTTLTQPVGGTRSFVAAIGPDASSLPAADQVLAQSGAVTATWLAASIDAMANNASPGGVVHIVATANADLTSSPWSMGIFDDQGQLVGPVCKSGDTCTADVSITGTMPSFRAAIGAVPAASPSTLTRLLQKVTGPSKLVDVQAQSALVKPSVQSNRMLWGVDSCKSFMDDSSGGGNLYQHIAGTIGSPDFWGRYLTDAVCPPLSTTEIEAAHGMHMGILPIYNERDCSNVSGYDTGLQYAAEAVAAAQAIGMPEGRGIAIDIEPSGPACPGAANLDTGLIHGWYDGITAAHYAPIYYGNTTPGTEFATQWCYTVNSLPYIGESSYLWSFQPSLLGGYSRANAPNFNPSLTGCLGYVHGWQYQIGSSSWAAPDVDQDQTTSEMPIWYP